MNTASYPAWDNRQIAHFLCRADRRVLSQPHSWLHGGVWATEVPVQIETPVSVEAPNNVTVLWRRLGVNLLISAIRDNWHWIVDRFEPLYQSITNIWAKILEALNSIDF